MAENILAAACENESRNAAKRMRLDAYHVDEQIALDKPSSGGGGALREPSSLAHSAYSLAASAFSSQDATLYINGAGISYTYRGYPGLGAAMQHPVSLTGGTSAQSNGKRRARQQNRYRRFGRVAGGACSRCFFRFAGKQQHKPRITATCRPRRELQAVTCRSEVCTGGGSSTPPSTEHQRVGAFIADLLPFSAPQAQRTSA